MVPPVRREVEDVARLEAHEMAALCSGVIPREGGTLCLIVRQQRPGQPGEVGERVQAGMEVQRRLEDGRWEQEELLGAVQLCKYVCKIAPQAASVSTR